MSIDDLTSAVELIRDNSHLADFSGAQPEARIARAESALHVTFPGTYRQFLARFGCGSFYGLEFYGLVKDDFENSGVPDAVWLSLDLRKTASMPDSYIVVADTGDGGFYAIDASRKHSDGESPVVEWWPGFLEAIDNGRIVASDFGAFFLGEISQAIARAKRKSAD